MINKLAFNHYDYDEYFYMNQLRDAKIGSCILVCAFSLFLYADFHVFHYPKLIYIYRLGLIIYFTLFFVVSYFFKDHKHVLKRYYVLGLSLLILFTSVINIVLDIARPELLERGKEVYTLIMISSFLFAGFGRLELSFIVASNLVILITWKLLFLGLSLSVFFDYFNIISFSIIIMIFNYIYINTKVREYKSQLTLKQKIEELGDEIKKRKQLEKQLKDLATYDELTHCYQRGAGFKLLEELIETTDCSLNPLSICYMDLNNLKVINDTYGHNFGDMLIKKFVHVVSTQCMAKDILIRLGGDEFLLVMFGFTKVKAEEKWKQINENLKAGYLSENNHFQISVSHGIVEYKSSNYKEIDDFINEADMLMYEEKKNRLLST